MNLYTPIIHFADGSETAVYEHQTTDFELALAVCKEQYNSAVERNRTDTGHASDVVKVTVRIDTLTEPEFIRWQKEQEILNMDATTRAQRAYKELQAMGAPVMHFGYGAFDGESLFAISGERNEYPRYNRTTGEFEGETIIWADYYGEFGSEYPEVDPRIEKVLEKYDLAYEWYDPSVITVYGY